MVARQPRPVLGLQQPAAVKAERALVRSIEREEILRALRASSEVLLAESDVHEDAAKIASLLHEILD